MNVNILIHAHMTLNYAVKHMYCHTSFSQHQLVHNVIIYLVAYYYQELQTYVFTYIL